MGRFSAEKPVPPSQLSVEINSNPYESCLADLLAVEGYEG